MFFDLGVKLEDRKVVSNVTIKFAVIPLGAPQREFHWLLAEKRSKKHLDT
jgi:hypothetical protein